MEKPWSVGQPDENDPFNETKLGSVNEAKFCRLHISGLRLSVGDFQCSLYADLKLFKIQLNVVWLISVEDGQKNGSHGHECLEWV